MVCDIMAWTSHIYNKEDKKNIIFNFVVSLVEDCRISIFFLLAFAKFVCDCHYSADILRTMICSIELWAFAFKNSHFDQVVKRKTVFNVGFLQHLRFTIFLPAGKWKLNKKHSLLLLELPILVFPYYIEVHIWQIVKNYIHHAMYNKNKKFSVAFQNSRKRIF